VIKLDLTAFEEFCGRLLIPSRDAGLIPLTLWGTQRYWLQEVAAGLEAGVHDFVTLKGGRQIGGSTVADAMALWWPQANDGTQGMLVSDEDDNRDYRRDLLLEMNQSLPMSHRLPMRLNNRTLAAWPNGSRLAFRAAGKRLGSNLGRSRGINFLHADELGTWPEQRAISALNAALSQRHPRRLYLWNSTGNGIGSPFHDMWKAAQTAVTTRAIFIGWWLHEGYVLSPADKELWNRYATDLPNEDEKLWMRAIESRYGVRIKRGQLAWYRWMLMERFFGDETMMAQEFPCLPEDAFQAFGDKFIAPRQIRRMRLGLADAPVPKGYDYEFLETLDETAARGFHATDPERAALRIWEEPAHDGVYVVSGHPAYSSSDRANLDVVQVYRVWPDRMVQVAEYAAKDGITYQLAWVILHLAGAYRTFTPAYVITEVAMTGNAVLEQIQALERHGYGLSTPARGKIQDFLGSVRHYYYTRPDHPFGRLGIQDWKMTPSSRTWVVSALRDLIQQGKFTPRSATLVDTLALLRRGEDGNRDSVGAMSGDSHAMCAAIAVEMWLRTAMPDLINMVAPKEPEPDDPRTVPERLVGSYLAGVVQRGRAY